MPPFYEIGKRNHWQRSEVPPWCEAKRDRASGESFEDVGSAGVRDASPEVLVAGHRWLGVADLVGGCPSGEPCLVHYADIRIMPMWRTSVPVTALPGLEMSA